MLFRFTAAGESLWQTDPLAFQATRLVLTTAFGYTLANPPTALQGTTVVYDQTVTPGLSKQVVNTNTVRYSHLLDNTVGDFSFGECGLYSGATLVAVGVNPTPIQKVAAAGADDGNRIILNIFLSDSTQDAYGFVRLSNSDDNLALGQIRHVDMLDPPYEREPNTYVVNGLDPADVPCIAFSDNFGRWNFTSAPLRYYEGTVSAVDPNGLAVDIAADHNVDFELDPSNYILQFISGPARGYCRRLNNIGTTFFAWATPTIKAPLVGDQFLIVGPQASVVNITGQVNLQFQDEGVNLGTSGTVTTVDIVGAGATATRTGNKVTVNVPSGSGGGNRVHTLNYEGQSLWTFDGTPNNAWNITPAHAAPSPAFLSVTGDNLTFSEGGVYRFMVFARIDVGGETLNFPNHVTGFGVQMAVTGTGTILSPNASRHSRFTDFAEDPYPTFGGFGPPPADAVAYGASWLDMFVAQLQVGDELDLSLFVYNYNDPITEYGGAMTVVIDKISDDVTP